MDRNISTAKHFFKGAHCNFPFVQQVKIMLKIKLQDAPVFSMGLLWLWNPEEQREQHNYQKKMFWHMGKIPPCLKTLNRVCSCKWTQTQFQRDLTF